MQNYILSALLCISATFLSANPDIGKTTLSGKITDKSNGDIIPGATIYIPDLKTGAISGIDGTYKIQNLPSSKLLIQVSFTGYKMIFETIDLSTTVEKNFELELSAKEINEVVITGTSQSGERNKTPTPITIVSKTQLLQNASTNIIDALAKQPGISQVTTGAGISKPVIRGLGYNRVVVVNDGIRQEGQQWGDEHGIEIDEFSVNKVEILKGPASLTYGSDAIAGVINMISAPTLPEGQISGNVIGNYQTNNGLIAYSANVSGNKKGFIWDLRYSSKMAHAYQNKNDGYVLNSGFKGNSFSGIIGLNKSWGYSHLHFSAYEFQPGIIEGARDSATGRFVKPIVVNDTTEETAIAGDSDFKSYSSQIPYQKIKHYKAVLNSNFVVRKGYIKSTLGFQQNQRQEFGDVFDKKKYGLYFLLNTFNYDLRYVFPEKKKFNGSIGVNGMQQTSKNKGSEFLVPEYSLFDLGGFAIAKKEIGKLDLSAGIRYDLRAQQGDDLYLDSLGTKTDNTDSTSIHKFNKFNSTFSGFSGSIGATYQCSENVYLKLNLARGYRAPNISELGANGEHEGTGRYEIGEAKLKAERSLQTDLALGINSEHATIELDVFYNQIDNYIFLQKLTSFYGYDSTTDGAETFEFVQGKAELTGTEISVDIHPHPVHWLHFENSFSMVYGTQPDRKGDAHHLPMIPAPKLVSELKADVKKVGKWITNAYVSLEFEQNFGQKYYYGAYGTETSTPGYSLLNLGIGTDVQAKKRTLCSIYVSVNNLTDEAYQNHLSRLKYTEMNNLNKKNGVFNMGRNISVRLLIPLELKRN